MKLRVLMLMGMLMLMGTSSVTQIPKWRTIPETAKAAETSAWAIRREIAEGRLRARHVGKLIRVLDEDLAEWMRNGGGGEAS